MDFYDIKGDLEALLQALGINNIEFKAKTHNALHPGKTVAAYKNAEQIAWCGVLHPSLAQEFDVEEEVLLFECKLDLVKHSEQSQYKNISKFPKIMRDLAFLAAKDVSFASIEKFINAAADSELLKSVQIFDVYEGDRIPPNKKSLAINLIIQSSTKTLTDDEINAFLQVVIKALTTKLNMILRDGT